MPVAVWGCDIQPHNRAQLCVWGGGVGGVGGAQSITPHAVLRAGGLCHVSPFPTSGATPRADGERIQRSKSPAFLEPFLHYFYPFYYVISACCTGLGVFLGALTPALLLAASLVSDEMVPEPPSLAGSTASAPGSGFPHQHRSCCPSQFPRLCCLVTGFSAARSRERRGVMREDGGRSRLGV